MKVLSLYVAVSLIAGFATHAIATPVYRVHYLGFTNPNGLGWDMNNSGFITGMDNSSRGFIRSYETNDGQYVKGLRNDGYMIPAAVNDSGQIAGNASDENFRNHAVLYSGGNLVDLGIQPGYTSSTASSINSSGAVVGFSSTSVLDTRAFLYQNGVRHDLGPGTPYAINDSGVIVGTSSDRAVKYENGLVVDLGNFGDSRLTSAVDINESGQILGRSYVFSEPGNPSHPFLYENGVWRDLGLPPGVPLGIPIAINNRGEVIGNSNGSQGASNRPPFLYTNGSMYNLSSLLDDSGIGLNLQLVYDIDDYGRIYAQGNTSFGYQAVLLIPIPEPSTCMLSFMLFGLSVTSRRVSF